MSNFHYESSKEVTCTFNTKDIQKILKYVDGLRLTKLIIQNLNETIKTNQDQSIEYLLYDRFLILNNILINENEHIKHKNKKINKNRNNTKNYTYLFILQDKNNNFKEFILTLEFGDELLFQRTDIMISAS